MGGEAPWSGGRSLGPQVPMGLGVPGPGAILFVYEIIGNLLIKEARELFYIGYCLGYVIRYCIGNCIG